MAGTRTYTSEEIKTMTPGERSAAWHYADETSKKALHAANQTDLGGSHNYNHETGVWSTKNPTEPTIRTADYMSALAGGYNFDENKIRRMFDAATQKEYAAKRAANANAQNQYAGNVGGYINTLSDTMRQSLNKAVATGGSRGLAAAEAMQAAQDATLQTSEQANNLALERMQLDYDEAEAYAKNVKDAEALSMERKAAALTQALQLGQIDAQTYAAEMGALGNYYYSGDAARQNFYGNVYTADKNAEVETRGQDLTFNTNSMGQLLDILKSNNVTEEGRTALEGILRDFGFNIPEGSLQASPTPIYSGGGYSGGGYSGGGYYNNTEMPTSVEDAIEANMKFDAEIDTNLNKYLLYGNKNGYASTYYTGNKGDKDAGKQEYETRYRESIYLPAQKLPKDQYIDYLKTNFNASHAKALQLWNRWGRKDTTLQQRVNGAIYDANKTK